MKKIFLIILIIFYSNSLLCQKGNTKLFREYEDTLKIVASKIMYDKTEEEKNKSNKYFIEILSEVLSYEKAFNFPFDSLITISRIYSPDKTFRIFTWILKKDNGNFTYYGIVHYHNKKRKKYEIIPLFDNSDNIRNPEDKELNANNWYGGLYYDIIYVKKTGRKFYTLLAWDGNDGYSTRKIIDVMYFSGKNKIKFGLPIFKENKNTTHKRIILEYDSKSTITMRYDEKENRITFNHLIPARKDLLGLEEYYIPDGSFNSYNYRNGKWWFSKDIDVRNKNKLIRIKKPTKGLMPR